MFRRLFPLGICRRGVVMTHGHAHFDLFYVTIFSFPSWVSVPKAKAFLVDLYIYIIKILLYEKGYTVHSTGINCAKKA